MQYRSAASAIFVALSLAGCNGLSAGSVADTARQSFHVGTSTFSVPVGSRGYVSQGKDGANWGYDPQVWAQTIGQLDVRGGGRIAAYPIDGHSGKIYAEAKSVMARKKVKPSPIGGTNAFISTDPIYQFPPVYIYQNALPGYVECPTSTTGGKEADMSRCQLNIIKDGVQHAFFITKDQVPLAASVARAFLATIIVK